MIYIYNCFYLRLTLPVLSVINDRAREVVRCKSIIPLGVGVGPSEYEHDKFKINEIYHFLTYRVRVLVNAKNLHVLLLPLEIV